MDIRRKTRKNIRTFFNNRWKIVLFCIIIVGILSSTMVSGITQKNTNTTSDTTPEVKIIDVSAVIDVSQIGEIPLGQMPDERITVITSVVNTGITVLSGLQIKTFLVKEGREDTISTQLGSDFQNVEFNPGEVKKFKNNYMVSKNLKPGSYKVLVRIDSERGGNEKSSTFIQYISDKTVRIGAYAEAGGSVPIYSPSLIGTPGSYLVMRDIQGGDRNSILKIACSDVTIDGGGHTIQGMPSGFTSAIYADGANTIRNVNIKNCVFNGVDFGIWFYRVESGSIVNCTFNNCKNIGIRLDQSRAITISDNILTDNVMGIGAFQSMGNKISNNYLKNQFNAAANDDQRNNWSSETQPGTNIAGGGMKGGNVWLDLNGSGFSMTTPDLNHDGIVDAPYTINGNNIDYYPIAVNQTPATQPIPGSEPSKTIDEPENSSENNTTSAGAPLDELVNTTPAVKQTTTLLPTPTIMPMTDAEKDIDGDFADLVISNLNVTDSVCIGTDLPIASTVENIGYNGANYFSIHYYLSDDQVITTSDKEIGSHLIENLKPHEKRDIIDILKIPTETGLRMYFIGAIVDPSNNIYEKNKVNNIELLNHRVQIKAC
jgi:parallel beta-helix repeat protein